VPAGTTPVSSQRSAPRALSSASERSPVATSRRTSWYSQRGSTRLARRSSRTTRAPQSPAPSPLEPSPRHGGAPCVSPPNPVTEGVRESNRSRGARVRSGQTYRAARPSLARDEVLGLRVRLATCASAAGSQIRARTIPRSTDRHPGPTDRRLHARVRRHGSAIRARLPKEYPEPCTNMPPGWQSADSQLLTPVGLVVLPGFSPVRLLCFPMGLPGGTLTLCRLLRVITGLPHGVQRMVRQLALGGVGRKRGRPDWHTHLMWPPNEMRINCGP
jgi:hypothetical protein